VVNFSFKISSLSSSKPSGSTSIPISSAASQSQVFFDLQLQHPLPLNTVVKLRQNLKKKFVAIA